MLVLNRFFNRMDRYFCISKKNSKVFQRELAMNDKYTVAINIDFTQANFYYDSTA